MQRHADIFRALAAPFERGEIKERSQSGRKLSYITARTAMNRLDNVIGPADWWDDYVTFGNGVKCLLTVRLPDGSTVTKAGVGGCTEMHDASDTDKTGESDALKRAGVKFGIGRYLYQDGVAVFEATPAPAPAPEIPPAPAPAPATRNGRSKAAPAATPAPPPATPELVVATPAPTNGRTPASGGSLWRLAVEHEQANGPGMVRRLLQYGVPKGWSSRMTDWSGEQATEAFAATTATEPPAATRPRPAAVLETAARVRWEDGDFQDHRQDHRDYD